MLDFEISRHAVDQYRLRVLACPERSRTDDQLRTAIKDQLNLYPMHTVNKALVVSAGPWRPKKKKPWELTLAYPTHMFVVDSGSIVTTLGFMMRPKKKVSIKARARRRRLYLELSAQLIG